MNTSPRKSAGIGGALVFALVVNASAMTGTSALHSSTKSLVHDVLDIIVVIDNSSTMGAEISSLQDELYDHLVALQIAEGVDTRVIVIAKHGAIGNESVCFEAPLSSTPEGGCAPPPNQPGITDGFKHYSIEVGSLDAWCLLISTFDGTISDDFGLAPNGWSDWLRPGAFKVILVVTDDGVMCGSYDDSNSSAGGMSAASAIDTDLLALSPASFGTVSDRKYIVHSLVGLVANTQPTDPWPATDPITESVCAGAVSAGTGHQGMATLTGGLRFPICAPTDYDLFLEDLSTDTTARLPFFADPFESGDTSAWTKTVP